MTNIIAGLAVAVAIIGGVIAYALTLEGRISSLETTVKQTFQAQLEGALQTLDERKGQALEEIKKAAPGDLSRLSERVDALERRPRPGFGDWQDREVGEVYQAETDGFLTAYTWGVGVNKRICLETEASEAAIRTRDPRGSCNEDGVRTRAGAYDGSVTPVKQGHWYTVHLRNRWC